MLASFAADFSMELNAECFLHNKDMPSGHYAIAKKCELSKDGYKNRVSVIRG